MDMLKTMAVLEALKLKLLKYDNIEDLRAQEVDSVLYLLSSIRTSYYQGGATLALRQILKVLIS
jgi:hypothetical protein